MCNLGHGTAYSLSQFMGNTKLDGQVSVLPRRAELSFGEMLPAWRADKKQLSKSVILSLEENNQ